MKLKKEWPRKETGPNLKQDDPGHDDFATGWQDQVGGRVMRQTGKKPTASESKAIAGYTRGEIKGLLK